MPKKLFVLEPPPGVADPDTAEKFIRRTRDAAVESGDVFAAIWPTGLGAESVLAAIYSWFAFEVKPHGLRGLVFRHTVGGTCDHEGGTELYRLFPTQWEEAGNTIEVHFSIHPDRNIPVKVTLKFHVLPDGRVVTSEPQITWV